MASVATLPPAAHAYHVYPAPPPTVNQLSSKQKAQLRRSTTKLGKVLGTTPHLVDAYPDPRTVSVPRPLDVPSKHTSLPSAPSPSRPRKLSHKRAKSERVHPDSYPLSSSMHHQQSRHNRTSAPVTPHRLSVEASYPASECSKRPPTLQVHTPRSSHRYSQSTGGIPYTGSSSSSRSTLSSEDRPPVTHAIPRKPVPSFNGPPPARDSLCDSLYEPKFTIPSETALRRAKLARVQKRLGEDVPIHLVFPKDAGMEEESEGEEDAAAREVGVDWVFVTSPIMTDLPVSERVYSAEKTKTADQKRASSSYRILRLDRFNRDSKSSTSSCTTSVSSAASNSSCSSSSFVSTPAHSNPPSPVSVSPSKTSSSHHSHYSTQSQRHSHSRSRSYSAASPTPTLNPTAYNFQEYSADAGLASPAGRREFAVYIPKQHAVRRGSVVASGKRETGEFELVRGFGSLNV